MWGKIDRVHFCLSCEKYSPLEGVNWKSDLIRVRKSYFFWKSFQILGQTPHDPGGARMDHLPVFLDVKDKTVLVDGGGTGAARRAERALSAGARVRLFDPTPGAEVMALVGRVGFTLLRQRPQPADFENVIIAYGASDDPLRDTVLHREGRAAGALVNVADVKHLCDFITPAVVERDAVTVAISTGGTAPVIGRILRARIEAMLPSGYGKLARFLSQFRGAIEAHVTSGRKRRRFWEQMIDGPVADSFLAGDSAQAQRLIEADLQASHDMSVGGVTIVGVGSGEADLISFRALNAMQRADLVLHEPSAQADLLALTRRDAERQIVEVGASSIARDAAAQGRRVVWLVPGAAQGEARVEAIHDALRAAGLVTQIIPGVASRQMGNVVELPNMRPVPHALSLTPRVSR